MDHVPLNSLIKTFAPSGPTICLKSVGPGADQLVGTDRLNSMEAVCILQIKRYCFGHIVPLHRNYIIAEGKVYAICKAGLWLDPLSAPRNFPNSMALAGQERSARRPSRRYQ